MKDFKYLREIVHSLDGRSFKTGALLAACNCEKPRGPVGGVCGNCAMAILTEEEKKK